MFFYKYCKTVHTLLMVKEIWPQPEQLKTTIFEKVDDSAFFKFTNLLSEMIEPEPDGPESILRAFLLNFVRYFFARKFTWWRFRFFYTCLNCKILFSLLKYFWQSSIMCKCSKKDRLFQIKRSPNINICSRVILHYLAVNKKLRLVLFCFKIDSMWNI